MPTKGIIDGGKLKKLFIDKNDDRNIDSNYVFKSWLIIEQYLK